jgi:signal transduction histidine kinase
MTPPEAMPRILVIDDELGPRESLRFLLKNEYQVLCAESVERGLQLLREQPPDTVIMDLRMPGRNGIDGLRDIRRLDPDVAVIILTGYAALETAQEAVRHEASEYMEKPFDAGEMRQAVRLHVARTRVRRRRETLSREVERLHDRLSAELRQKDHMAELGEASAEFVHDLRNALTVLCGSAQMLRMELGPDAPAAAAGSPSEVTGYLGMMERTVRQCQELLDAWQRLIRQDPGERVVFPLALLVRQAVAAAEPAAAAVQARLACAVDAADAEIRGDRVQIGRALANMLQNAIQALPPANGAVEVTVARTADGLSVRIADNGCGIPSEDLPRLFTSRFTTRRDKGGMGLGLFIARKIVEAHGGRVAVETEVGRGTVLTVTLPEYVPAAKAGA